MKIIKYLLFLLLILFIAGSIYVATKDGDYHVEKSRVIQAPVTLLYNEASNFSTWESWSYWGTDEDVILNLTEEPNGKITQFSWENAELGDGSITTEEEIPYSSIDQNLHFETTVTDVDSDMYWNFEPSGNGTKVTWGIRGNQSFKEKLAFTLRDGDIGDIFNPILESGLERLEQKVILKMEEYSINVDGTTQHGGGFYMYMTTAAKINEVNARAAEMIQQVRHYMEDNNITINGEPFILYNQRDDRNNSTIFSAAIPTPSQVITPAGSPVLNGFLPAQKAVKATLKGNVKNASEAWEEAYRYMEENDLQVNPEGVPFEVYITNPAEEQNPALWVTEIYIPVL